MHSRRVRRALAPIGTAVMVLAHAGLPGVAASRPTIAAAASLNDVLPVLLRSFERSPGGARLEVVYGASGVLARQIRDGAPFELFLSADEEAPRRLAQAGVTRGDGVVYAAGRLALFAPVGSPLTLDERLEGLAALLKAGRVTRFAIANPDLAPYGRAAEAVLRRRGLWEALQPHLLRGESVAQAAQFATTGHAVGGLVAASLARSPALMARGTFALIPVRDHPPITHRMVLLKHATPTSSAFYAYLQSAEARAVLERYGFGAPA